MTYRLKTTGLALKALHVFAVDPDTDQIKDFADSTVNAGLVKGANVTIGSQNWNGVARKYWRYGAGTADADFVKLNSPGRVAINSSMTTGALVYIGEWAGGGRVIGQDSSNYFNYNSPSSNSHPMLVLNSISVSGALPGPGAVKCLFGLMATRGGAAYAYSGVDTATPTKVTTALGAVESDWSFSYLGRQTDSTQHAQDRPFLVASFTSLTDAEVEALRVDWFGALLELEPAVDPTITGTVTADDAVASGGMGVLTSSLTGTVAADEAVAAGVMFIAGLSALTGTLVADDALASGALGVTSPATIVSGQFKSTETKLLLGAATFSHAVLLRVSDRHPAASVAAPTTASNSRMTISSVGLTAGVAYLLVVWNVDGTLAGVEKVIAA